MFMKEKILWRTVFINGKTQVFSGDVLLFEMAHEDWNCDDEILLENEQRGVATFIVECVNRNIRP